MRMKQVPISLLLADDQALFREAMSTLLALDGSVKIVAQAANGEEAVKLAGQCRPQVVLMDLRMPVMDGVEATRRVLAAHPDTRVLVLTTFEEEEEIFAALRAGAAGYVLKNTPAAQLVEAVRIVAAGGTYLQPSVATQVVAGFNRLSRRLPADAASGLDGVLSQRELDILRCLLRGMSNKEIAAALHLTEGTVKNHMTSIFGKLQVQDRTAAALKAREMGLS